MKNQCNNTDLCNVPAKLLRPRFFAGQLITDAELTAGQEYFRNKMRLHNMQMHGWGVVCGLLVCRKPTPDGAEAVPWKLVVTPGYALGHCGDDIYVDCEHEIDLRTSGSDGEWADGKDPWCSPAPVKPHEGPLYVAVKYIEVPVRPVRVEPMGCGCDESECEYSRWRDCYRIGILHECPQSHLEPPAADANQGPNPECPPIPECPWVVLAKVEVDADGNVVEIDQCSCRRVIVSHGGFWRKCDDPPDRRAIIKDVVASAEIVQGREGQLELRGRNFVDLKTEDVRLGPGVKIVGIEQKGNAMAVKFEISADAQPGPRRIEVEKPPGLISAAHAFNVVKAVEEESDKPSDPSKPDKAAPAKKSKKSTGGKSSDKGGKRSKR